MCKESPVSERFFPIVSKQFVIGFLIGIAITCVLFATWKIYPLSRQDYINIWTWVGSNLEKFFPWPILIILLFLFRSPRSAAGEFFNSLSDFFRGLATLPMRANELDFWIFKAKQDPENAKKLVKGQTLAIEEEFDKNINDLITKTEIDEIFEQYFNDTLQPLVNMDLFTEDDHLYYRATLHIKDKLHKDTLYQLLDYKYSDGRYDKARGRRKSIRFGIIGKAWRTKNLQYDPKVDVDPKPLIEKWGMTEDEARSAGRGQKSHLAVPIPNDDPQYVIFMDGTPEELLLEQPDSNHLSIEAEKSNLTKNINSILKNISHIDAIIQ